MQEQHLTWYLVRHGVTEWNRIMRFQGQTDVPLHQDGIEQARRIAARLAALKHPPELVWSSDLVRARVTAEAIASQSGVELRTTPLLREIMLGDWEGLTHTEIADRGQGEQLALYRSDSLDHRPPGGETVEDTWHRLVEAGRMIREDRPTGAVAIVGHGGTLRVLICEAMGTSMASIKRLSLDNASLSVIRTTYGPEGAKTRVLLVNDTSHLAGLEPRDSHTLNPNRGTHDS